MMKVAYVDPNGNNSKCDVATKHAQMTWMPLFFIPLSLSIIDKEGGMYRN